MILIIICYIFVAITVILVTLRLKINMAALVAWLIHSITNARSVDEQSESKKEEDPEPSTSKNSKSKAPAKSKQKQNKKPSNRARNNDPSLSPTIKSSIEESPEESTSEGPSSLEENISNKNPTKKKPKENRSSEDVTHEKTDDKNITKKKIKTSGKSKPELNIETPETDVVGFSFFKAKPVKKINLSENQDRKELPKGKKVPLEATPPTDEIGFSFLPVRDKKNIKKLGKEKLNEKPDASVNKVTLPSKVKQPNKFNSNFPVSQQRKPTNQKQGEEQTVKKFIDTIDKSSEYTVVNKVEQKQTDNKFSENVVEVVNKGTGKSIFLPVRESKKVDASLSYARIASQGSAGVIVGNNTNKNAITETKYSGLNGNISKEEVSINTEQIDGYESVKDKLQAFEKLTSLSKVIDAEKGPELSRLHKIIVSESEKKDQVFEHFGSLIDKDNTTDSLVFQNIEKSEKKLENLGSVSNEFSRAERTEVISTQKPTQQENTFIRNIIEENSTFKQVHGNNSNGNSIALGTGIDLFEKKEIDLFDKPETDEFDCNPNEFHSIQEFLETEKVSQKHLSTAKEIVPKSTAEVTKSQIQPVESNPLVLEKTFEIFEKPQTTFGETSQENTYQIIEKQSKIVESDQHLIEKQSLIEEYYTDSSEISFHTSNGASSIIETSTIIETCPLIEAQTIIETFPNLGSSPTIETTTVVTSNTGYIPTVEASTIIESFNTRNATSLLETSTIIVTSRENSTPICFETSAIIESLPHDSESLVEAVTTVETPSNSDISIDVATSSIIETLPEKEGSKLLELEEKTALPIELRVLEDTKSVTESFETICARAAKKMSPNVQVRILTLNDQENQESTVYRIEKNWVLEFRLGASLLGRKVLLHCNYPDENKEFNRKEYRLLTWNQDEGCKYADDTALESQIVAKVCGSFHYYFTYDDCDTPIVQGQGYFLVDPTLKYGNNEQLPLDCIQMQTVISKNLGSFSTWQNKLKVSKESGYNMIHFTPIQELGASNSAYSLSEQLKLNPIFDKEDGTETSFEDVEKLIQKLRKEWKVMSVCDIVLNHTANESKWIQIHPEATYNCLNCPYLRPSYLVDAAIHQFSIDVSKGLYENKGIPIEVCTEDHLNAIRYHLLQYLSEVKVEELYMCDVTKYVAEFLNFARTKIPCPQMNSSEHRIMISKFLELVQDPEYRRLKSTVDINLALELYNVFRPDCFDEESRLKKCLEHFKTKLDSLNDNVKNSVKEYLDAAVENCIASIRYFRVQHDGPKIEEVSVKDPIVGRYFTDYGKPATLEEHEEIMYSENSKHLMAHNGWVMNADPLNNFAAPGSTTYIKRELIAWGDSVKLRYGDKPEDCPFLWNHMKQYVEQTARIFDGVRLDNCHSTPIPVAEYLLDCARKVRPDLYVVAELFTNSDLTDNIFVNKLGITSLIREAMAAWDAHEEGRLVYRYGGHPVGSFFQPNILPLVPSIAHALFLDLTHDNPSPVEKRSVFDMLPSGALVTMACCASGSNRGYDELVPHHIHVVDETREYTEWTSDETLADNNPKYVSKNSGIIAAKKAMNDLHYKLGNSGFNQVYVDQMDPDIVAVTRHSPVTHQSYILIAFTSFGYPSEDAVKHQRGIKPLRVEGTLDEIVLEATLSYKDFKSGGEKYKRPEKYEQDESYINGYTEYELDIKQNIQVEESGIFEKVDSGAHNMFQLNFKNFKPGSIAVVKVSLPVDMRESVENVRNLITGFSLTKHTELSNIISRMTLADLNRALYHCDQEERDEGNYFDVYNIPNFAPMVYAGLQGFMSLLANIRPHNDLGHPMCCNLRDGNWMIDYIWERLKLDEGTKELGQWIEENTKSLKGIPRYLIPCYFDVIITGIYVLLLEQCFNLMNDFVQNGSTFVKGLSLGSVQLGAYIKSADLPALSPNIFDPKPPKRKNSQGEVVQTCVSLSAGLPHFSVGYMRNWGRDTFIAMRGLLILTGRFREARYHILGYGQCLRHGLIPNLLDGGRNPRYNCRDAVWWWMHCIKCYIEEAPNGISILEDKVSRIFPSDDSPAQPPGAVDQPLYDVMQEALNVHFQGLAFRERNAGRQIDEHMTDKGFNNQIGVHPETGFVFGGNDANCGTWMDKMGSSDKAGIRGKPATPRDGSAVELIGLSKSVITWLDKLYKQKHYPYSGVERTHKGGTITKWSFQAWADKIQTNFERYFWINSTPLQAEIRPDLINKRGIYKDCYGASQEWTDYQLRCNYPIAMVVAPELFDPQHAWIALSNAEKHLLGPLGMKTLDPDDWAYNGDYDNSNDSNDPKTSHGFNYHQGPEWVWPIGYFLRAKLKFAEMNGELKKTLEETKVILSRHYVELQTSPWRGLPELTNSDGAYCKDSSRTQAWSMSCVLEVLHDLQRIERQHIV